MSSSGSTELLNAELKSQTKYLDCEQFFRLQQHLAIAANQQNSKDEDDIFIFDKLYVIIESLRVYSWRITDLHDCLLERDLTHHLRA